MVLKHEKELNINMKNMIHHIGLQIIENDLQTFYIKYWVVLRSEHLIYLKKKHF